MKKNILILNKNKKLKKKNKNLLVKNFFSKKKIFLDINDNDKIIKQNSKRKILKIAKIGRNKTIQYSGYISFIIFFLISNFLIIKIS